jgi:hypothetical protein
MHNSNSHHRQLIEDCSTTKPTRPRWNQPVLSVAHVIEIFALKPNADASHQNSKRSNLSATTVARLYGVNEKTVRDIWTGRTWSKTTMQLDASMVVEQKKMGRPQGSKDARPRKRKNSEVRMSNIFFRGRSLT